MILFLFYMDFLAGPCGIAAFLPFFVVSPPTAPHLQYHAHAPTAGGHAGGGPLRTHSLQASASVARKAVYSSTRIQPPDACSTGGHAGGRHLLASGLLVLFCRHVFITKLPVHTFLPPPQVDMLAGDIPSRFFFV